MRKTVRPRAFAAVSVSAVLLLAAGCASPASTTTTTGSLGNELTGDSFTVGSKDFSESEILGEITLDLLKAHGAAVSDKTNIKGSVTTRDAMLSGDISMYWEYTGTAWIDYLKNTVPISDPAAQYQAVKSADLAKNGVAWLDAAPMNDTYAIAVLSTTAAKLKISTLTELAALSKTDPAETSVCVESEFAARPDGWPGVVKDYGMAMPSGDIKTLATGAIYSEVAKGTTCAFGEVFATDGRIAALKLTVLKDDKHFFPVYNAALTLPQKLLAKYPAIATIMNPVSAKLTDAVMQQLDAEVDVDGKTPAAVADAWLKAQGFIH